MGIWRKSKAGDGLEKQMLLFNYLEEHDEDERLGELYQKYRNYFSDFKEEFLHLTSTSNQIEGLVENIVDTSSGVQIAVEHIAQGAYAQAEDAGDCMRIVSMFSGRMNTMEQMTQELINLAYEMAAENKRSKEVMQSLNLIYQHNGSLKWKN